MKKIITVIALGTICLMTSSIWTMQQTEDLYYIGSSKATPKEFKGLKLLYDAIQRDDVKTVSEILTKYPQDVALQIHFADEKILDILHIALQRADEKIALWILQNTQIDPNFKATYHKTNTSSTPLHIVTTKDKSSTKLFTELLSHGADMNAQDSKSETAMHKAVFISRNDFLKILLAQGARHNIINNKGQTPLEIAQELLQKTQAMIMTHQGKKEVLKRLEISKEKIITSIKILTTAQFKVHEAFAYKITAATVVACSALTYFLHKRHFTKRAIAIDALTVFGLLMNVGRVKRATPWHDYQKLSAWDSTLKAIPTLCYGS